jgi:hypothetical protein
MKLVFEAKANSLLPSPLKKLHIADILSNSKFKIPNIYSSTIELRKRKNKTNEMGRLKYGLL